MKKRIFFLCLTFLLSIPVGAGALDDSLFDPGQSRVTGSEALFNAGLWVLMHPDSLKSLSETDAPAGEKQKDELDKKTDKAIQKAWEQQQ